MATPLDVDQLRRVRGVGLEADVIFAHVRTLEALADQPRAKALAQTASISKSGAQAAICWARREVQKTHQKTAGKRRGLFNRR